MQKERPILYSTPMVQALNAGTKTMTRRTKGLDEINENPNNWQFDCMLTELRKIDRKQAFFTKIGDDTIGKFITCPYGQVGDLIYVKETFYAFGHWVQEEDENEKLTWTFVDETQIKNLKYYYMDSPPQRVQKRRFQGTCLWYKRPSIFMPKAAARIWLEITNVRVERLYDIDESDAIDEGVIKLPCHLKFVHSFQTLWISINGEESWNANPWVWVVEFKKINK